MGLKSWRLELYLIQLVLEGDVFLVDSRHQLILVEQPPVELVLQYSHLAHFVLLVDVELDPLLGQRTRRTGFKSLGLERLLFLDVVQVLQMDLLCFKHVQCLNYVLVVVLVGTMRWFQHEDLFVTPLKLN